MNQARLREIYMEKAMEDPMNGGIRLGGARKKKAVKTCKKKYTKRGLHPGKCEEFSDYHCLRESARGPSGKKRCVKYMKGAGYRHHPGYEGMRHCVEEVMEPSGVMRCAKYAPRRGACPTCGHKEAMGGTRKNKMAAKHNPWIAHVKAFATQHGINYAQALKDPRTKASYK